MLAKLLRAVTLPMIAALLLCGGTYVAGAVDADMRQVLAPSGKLKVGLYPGTPTSIVEAQSGQPRGVGYDLGEAIARRLDVAYEPVVFSKNAEVLDAVKAGQVDMAFTNATAARARDMDFGPPYLEIESGYIVPQGSRVVALADIDTRGLRVGVTTGSSSDNALSRDLKSAEVVRAATLAIAIDMLRAGQIDAFATNKAALFEMAEKLPGSTVLDGRWGVERLAIAIPKGRDQGIDFIKAFTREALTSGLVRDAIARAGLRGAIAAESKQ